ncbi:Rho termination factor [Hydrocoleum sp. CS-953]|nr:Rho termination factor [Hydrocoleum sp. CS-953]
MGMSGVGMSMSGVGLTTSGMGMSMSGVGLTASGIGMSMSGVGMNMSGVAASMPPVRPRKFWLVADAELIIHGATEPDATVTIGGRPIKLNPDGTFRFQMAFPDGLIDYPIMAVAVDGEQNRSIHMKFTRETPERRTNTKEEAVLEWMN